MSSKPRYLKRHHHTWMFQLGVPAAVRQHFAGQHKIILSTGCHALADAQPIALRLAAEYKERFAQAAKGGTVDVLSPPAQVYRDKLITGPAVTMYGPDREDVGTRAMIEVGAIVDALPVDKATGEPVVDDPRTRALLAALQDYQRPPAARPSRPEYALSWSEAAQRSLDGREGELETRTMENYRTMFRLFSDFIGDKALALVTRRDVAEYLDALAKLKPTWGQTTAARSMTFAELRKRFAAGEGEPGLAAKTLNKQVVALAGVWTWAKKRDEVTGESPFTGHLRKTNGKTTKTYVHFDDADLAALFAPGHLWPRIDLEGVALVALYSGMRIAEITALTWADVRVEDGVTYFDITAAKTDAGVRKVPVHSKIASWLLGRRANDPGQLVFKPTIKSSHFTAHRRACGVSDGEGRYRKAFHSFRDTVVRCLSRAGATEDQIQQIVGHRRKSFTLSTYDTSGLTMRERQAVIEMIAYPGLVVPEAPR